LFFGFLNQFYRCWKKQTEKATPEEQRDIKSYFQNKEIKALHLKKETIDHPKNPHQTICNFFRNKFKGPVVVGLTCSEKPYYLSDFTLKDLEHVNKLSKKYYTFKSTMGKVNTKMKGKLFPDQIVNFFNF
jgi:hypothetical protein